MFQRLKTKNLGGISALLFYVLLVGVVGIELQNINYLEKAAVYEGNVPAVGEVLSEETSTTTLNKASPGLSTSQLRSALRSSKLNSQKRVALPFTAKGCTKKNLGDANCDDQINRGDLILWELEEKREKSGNLNVARKHSDFNKDGKVNSKDYAIWQTNTKSLSNSLTQEFVNSLAKLAQSLLPKFEVYAQQSKSDGEGSYGTTLPDGSSKLVNPTADGGYTITNLDSNNNPVSTQTFSSSGEQLSNTYYDGDDAATRIKSGNQTLIVNKSIKDEVVVETIGGSITQLWPTQESFNRGDSPQTVSLPSPEGSSLLSLQANNAGIMKQMDGSGNLDEESLMLGDGRIKTSNYQYGLTTESNGNNNFTSIRMWNSIGGMTDYLFHHQYGLVSISQTDKDKKIYFATSKNKNAKEWEMTTFDKDGKKDTKTVEDPIKEVGSNTPSPLDLLKETNDAVQRTFITTNTPFTEAFSGSKVQAKAADKLLAAKGSSDVLGISFINEVKADDAPHVGVQWSSTGSPTTTTTNNPPTEEGKDYQTTTTTYSYKNGDYTLNVMEHKGSGADNPTDISTSYAVFKGGSEPVAQGEGVPNNQILTSQGVNISPVSVGEPVAPSQITTVLTPPSGSVPPPQTPPAPVASAPDVPDDLVGVTVAGTGAATEEMTKSSSGPLGPDFGNTTNITYMGGGYFSITSPPVEGVMTASIYGPGDIATPKGDGSGYDVTSSNGSAASPEASQVSEAGVGSGWTDMSTGTVSLSDAYGNEVGTMSWNASTGSFDVQSYDGSPISEALSSLGEASYNNADMADNGVADHSVGGVDGGEPGESGTVDPGSWGGGGGEQQPDTSSMSVDNSSYDSGSYGQESNENAGGDSNNYSN
jgi:hypothetical protein